MSANPFTPGETRAFAALTLFNVDLVNAGIDSGEILAAYMAQAVTGAMARDWDRDRFLREASDVWDRISVLVGPAGVKLRKGAPS